LNNWRTEYKPTNKLKIIYMGIERVACVKANREEFSE
jgi:hypothetical protein